MYKFHGYEIDPDYLVEDSLDWHSAGLGEYIVGRKNGCRWFIKRNNEYRYLTEKDLPDKELLKERMKPALNYQRERAELRHLMVEVGGLSASKDHIVAEVEHFIDSKRIVLVSQFVENVARDADFTEMNADEFIVFCRAVAELLVKLHGCGVIHCDLKVGERDDVMNGNIVAAIEGGKLTPYLIDFDLSFPAPPAKNPESIPFSDNFESPEIVPYIDGDEEHCTVITTATDIFTLGVVYHRLWTGSFPGLEVEKSSTGRCVAADKEVSINGKFNVRIGDGCGATFMSLINWMFAKDPAARPTAQQVVDVLNDKIPVPASFHKGSDDKLFTSLWDAHMRMGELKSTDELQELGIEFFKRINDGGILKYAVKKKGSAEEYLTIDEIITAGYVVRKSAEVTETWPEHYINLISAEEIAKKGYSSIKRTTVAGHRYRIETMSGVAFTHGYEWLVNEGLATRMEIEPVECDTPWPGDGVYASTEYLTKFGVKRILRAKYGAENRYRIEYVDREPLDNVSVGTMKRLRYII